MQISRRQLFLAALFACVLIAGPSPLAGAAQARTAAPTIRVFVNGNGTVRGSGLDCGAKGTMCGVSFALGTTITFEAFPEPSSVFAGWSGACVGIGPVCTITAGDPTTVTATFSYIEVVDVNKTGEGQGTVTSGPTGIDCGTTCSAPFTGNTKVTLTARPSAGSAFVGWNGYCKGSGTCVLQQAYGTMAVTAEFQPKGKRTSSGTTGTTGKSGGVTINTSSGPFSATSQGASVRKTQTGRIITVRFNVSKAASVRLEVWHWDTKVSQARLSVQKGPVTIRYPFSAGYKAGEYHLWAYVHGAGEKKPKLLHWKLQVK